MPGGPLVSNPWKAVESRHLGCGVGMVPSGEENPWDRPWKLTTSSLPVEARGEFTTRLLDNLELSETEIQERWVHEAERRAEEMRSGEVVGEPVGEVLARIRAKLG